MLEKISGLSKVSPLNVDYYKQYKDGIEVRISPLLATTKRTNQELYSATISNGKGELKKLRNTKKRLLDVENEQLILKVLKCRKFKDIKKQKKLIATTEKDITKLNKEIMKMPGDAIYLRFRGTFEHLTKTLKLKSKKAVMAIIASRK